MLSENLPNNMNWGEANKACLDLDGKGWRLPTVIELNYISTIRRKFKIFNLVINGLYWTNQSSSIEDFSLAFKFYDIERNFLLYPRVGLLFVRPVRTIIT